MSVDALKNAVVDICCLNVLCKVLIFRCEYLKAIDMLVEMDFKFVRRIRSNFAMSQLLTDLLRLIRKPAQIKRRYFKTVYINV